jgi:hypothetical protein
VDARQAPLFDIGPAIDRTEIPPAAPASPWPPRLVRMHRLYGVDSDGRQCGKCLHCFAPGGVAGTYYKCRHSPITSGPATDWRVRWPACGRFEARQPAPAARQGGVK